jgi:glutamate 5-kinase
MLQTQGKSLLPVGVKSITGDFLRGEMVACVNEAGIEVARGLINYGSGDAQKIIGKPSQKIGQLLGYEGEPELLHRDNMIIVG